VPQTAVSPAAYPVSIKGVVVRDGQVLLLRNERDEWELPGGRIELGETPQQCIAREIQEETGWAVRTGPVLERWMYHVTVAPNSARPRRPPAGEPQRSAADAVAVGQRRGRPRLGTILRASAGQGVNSPAANASMYSSAISVAAANRSWCSARWATTRTLWS
jgi:8-oxo-dGTP pyrophosphatase MutT (NUDIX family)